VRAEESETDRLNSIVHPLGHKITLQLGVATLARLILNTSRRFAYPFASALSRGLGVPLVAITSLIAVNQVTGVLSPVFGPLGDRWGYRVMMLAGLAMLTGGMLAGGLLPTYGVVLLALFLAGLGKSVFDPALHAYVGQRVPYQRRGLAIGMLEFAWAGSALVGLPLVGLLIERMGWRAPFFCAGRTWPAQLNRARHTHPRRQSSAAHCRGPGWFPPGLGEAEQGTSGLGRVGLWPVDQCGQR